MLIENGRSLDKVLQFKTTRRKAFVGALGLGLTTILGAEACSSDTHREYDLGLEASRRSANGWKVRYLEKGEIDKFEPQEKQVFAPNDTQVFFGNDNTEIYLSYTTRVGRGTRHTYPALIIKDFATGFTQNKLYVVEKRYLPFDAETLDSKIDPRVVAFSNVTDGSERYLNIVIKPENEGFLIQEYKTGGQASL